MPQDRSTAHDDDGPELPVALGTPPPSGYRRSTVAIFSRQDSPSGRAAG